eukprot:4048348-Pleurochrysis_carterae.AAC.1
MTENGLSATPPAGVADKMLWSSSAVMCLQLLAFQNAQNNMLDAVMCKFKGRSFPGQSASSQAAPPTAPAPAPAPAPARP